MAFRGAFTEAMVNRGLKRQKAKQFEAALDGLDEAALPQPENAEAYNNRGMALQRLNRFEEAIESYDNAIAISPDNVRALNNRGTALHQLKRFEEALASYNKAIVLRPDYLEALYNRGIALHALNRFEEALASYDEVIGLNGDSAEAFNNRAIALKGLKRLEDALSSCDKAIALKPSFAEALNHRGNILQELGQFDDALASYDKAIALAPNYIAALSNRGAALQGLGQFNEALASFDKAIALQPNNGQALCGRGNALKELRRFDEALASYDKAIVYLPENAEVLNNRGIVLHGLRRFEEALASYDKVLALLPDSSEVHNNRGNTLKELNRFDDALASYDRALALRPDNAEVHNSRAIELLELGRLAEAREAAKRAIQLTPGKSHYYHYTLASIGRYVADDPHLAAMEELSRRAENVPAEDRIALHFALAKAYDDLGRPQTAFAHLRAGNVLKRRYIQYDEAKALAAMNDARAGFTSELFRMRRNAGHPSSLPIFVIGMPRSGSTLVEQILASHPQVFGGGELKHFAGAVDDIRGKLGARTNSPVLVSGMTDQDIYELGRCYLAAIERIAPHAARITDKMTGNFNLAGLIHLALPNAAIIHTVRDPMDTCFSCFSKLFGPGDLLYTYDLGELGRYYRQYQALMTHWQRTLPPGRILDVRYEEVVADLEGQARRIIAYCGLEWDARCLTFHETKRAVRTSSAAQVRQPIYRHGVGRWRAYSEFTQALRCELDPVMR